MKKIIIRIFDMFDDALKDNATGHYSHARIIAMIVAFAATVFMWKLIIMGGMSIDYFISYLAYGTGAQTLNKFLDNRDPQRGTRQPENNANVGVNRIPINDPYRGVRHNDYDVNGIPINDPYRGVRHNDYDVNGIPINDPYRSTRQNGYGPVDITDKDPSLRPPKG